MLVRRSLSLGVITFVSSLGLIACSSVSSEIPDPVISVAAQEFEQQCELSLNDVTAQLASLEREQGDVISIEYLKRLDAMFLNLADAAKKSNLYESVHPDADVRSQGELCTQKLDKLGNNISLSRPLYDNLIQINAADFDDTDRFFLEKLLRDFRLSGVDKDDVTREKIKNLQEEIVKIGQQFDKTIRDDVRYLTLDSREQLAGLPEDYIAAHQPDDSGKIKISTRYPDYIPFITYAEDDALRKKMYVMARSRGYPDNKNNLLALLEKRHQLALLLGFDSYAERITADKMIGSPQAAQDFIDKVSVAATPALDSDIESLLNLLRQTQPSAAEVKRWQISYLEGKVKADSFGLDVKELRGYFSYQQVKQGVLQLVENLFQVQFKPWQTEVWHSSVEAWEMWDGDQLIGRFYLDMHPREGKYQHAAMFPTVTGLKDRQIPVATLVCNFPGLDSSSEKMEFSQVETFLHEFGHLLHELFAGNNKWVAHSGVSTEWDFVEAPSQMLEEWIYNKETLRSLALNDAGETIPDEIVDQLKAARNFNKGVSTRIQMFYAALSLNLYNSDPAGFDLDAIMWRLEKQYSAVAPVEGVKFYTNFGHLNGYSAIYYTYMWSQVIALDMFSEFEEKGVMNSAVANRYRQTVLAPGGSKPAAQLIKDFLGRDYNFESFAKRLQ